jgi:hypothetical protein
MSESSSRSSNKLAFHRSLRKSVVGSIKSQVLGTYDTEFRTLTRSALVHGFVLRSTCQTTGRIAFTPLRIGWLLAADLQLAVMRSESQTLAKPECVPRKDDFQFPFPEEHMEGAH